MARVARGVTTAMGKKKTKKPSPKSRKNKTDNSPPLPKETPHSDEKAESSGGDKPSISASMKPVVQPTGPKDTTAADNSQPQTAMSQLMEVQKEKLG